MKSLTIFLMMTPIIAYAKDEVCKVSPTQLAQKLKKVQDDINNLEKASSKLVVSKPNHDEVGMVACMSAGRAMNILNCWTVAVKAVCGKHCNDVCTDAKDEIIRIATGTTRVDCAATVLLSKRDKTQKVSRGKPVSGSFTYGEARCRNASLKPTCDRYYCCCRAC